MAEQAGIWLRVSTGGQNEANQEPDNRRHCAERSYGIAAIYTVHGKSAYKAEQDPDWQRVVKDVKTGKIQVVVIWVVDRLDRGNILHAIPMVNAVLEVGGRIEFSGQPYIDLTTMAGRMAFANLCEMAHEESKIKSGRIRNKHSELRALNALIGRPPFGYRVVCLEGCGPVNGKHHHPKTLEPDPYLASYVLGMVDRAIAGQTRTSICEWLEANKIRPPGKDTPMWQPKSVRDILSNPALIGRRKDSKGKTILRFTPILDDMDKWRALQHKLDSMPSKAVFANDDALLSGVVFCDKCGGIMHRRRIYNVRKDGSRQYNVYYRCDGPVRKWSTCKNMIPLAAAEAEALEQIMIFSEWPYITHDYIPGRTDYRDEMDDIEAQIDALDKRDPEYINKVMTLHGDLRSYELKQPEPGRYTPIVTDKTFAEMWESWDIPTRRQYLIDEGIKVFIAPGTHEVRVEGLSMPGTVAGMGGMTGDEYDAAVWEQIAAALRERGHDPDEIRRQARETTAMSPAERFRATWPAS
jgi:DNA invertase Pin-like site-specific DNA recombinase